MEFSIEVIHLMHPGKRKDHAGNPHQEDSTFPEAEKLNNSDRLFVVCDGMGGHDSGEVASDTVCRAIGNYITTKSGDLENFSSDDLYKALDAAFEALDAADTGASHKMGTTMALLNLYNKGAIIAHIGDSRVYHIRPHENQDTAKVLFRTYDHSLVFNMVKAGIMTEEEARTSPHRNVITKALQPHLDHRPQPDITKITDIRPGDLFYLCSDGMIENMNDTEIGEIFSKQGDDLSQLRETLLDLTKENHDNHTAIIVRILSVMKSEDEDLSDDFENFSTPPHALPPVFRKEDFKGKTISDQDISPVANEFTYLYRHESNDESDHGRGSSRRWWVIAIIGGIVALSAVLAFISSIF